MSTDVSTFTSVRGKNTAKYTMHAGAAFGATDPNSADALTYTYDEVGNLTEVDQLADNTGHAFNTWTSSYDLLGRLTDTSDPDSGRSTYSYYASGDVKSITSAAGTPDEKSLYYTYDRLGRRTAEYKGTTSSGPKQAAWNYDTVPALTAAQSQANPGSDTLGNLGRSAGSIRYSDSGAKYTESVGGYDATGHALSTATGIPNADGNGALGGRSERPVPEERSPRFPSGFTTCPAIATCSTPRCWPTALSAASPTSASRKKTASLRSTWLWPMASAPAWCRSKCSGMTTRSATPVGFGSCPPVRLCRASPPSRTASTCSPARGLSLVQ